MTCWLVSFVCCRRSGPDGGRQRGRWELLASGRGAGSGTGQALSLPGRVPRLGEAAQLTVQQGNNNAKNHVVLRTLHGNIYPQSPSLPSLSGLCRWERCWRWGIPTELACWRWSQSSSWATPDWRCGGSRGRPWRTSTGSCGTSWVHTHTHTHTHTRSLTTDTQN